jgi:tetratricopeptide (TPR) repeat protein
MTFRRSLLSLFLAVSAAGLLLQPLRAQDAPKPAETKQEPKAEPKEEKEPEAVDMDEAVKQASKSAQDIGYTKEEYEEFQKDMNLPSAQEKATALLQFVKAHPACKLNEHILGNIPTFLNQLYQEKNWSALAPLAEEFMQYKPEDLLALSAAMEASYTNKDYAKAVKYGELVYAKKPTAQVAQLLALCYNELKNESKFASYAEKCLGEMSPKEAFYYVIKLSYYYAERRDVPKAAGYCQKVLAAYGEGEIPPGYNAANWNLEKGRCYAIIGRNYSERKQSPQAIQALNNSVKFYPQNDEVYFYLGMSYWNMQDIPMAMKQFAKAVAMNKAYAKRSRGFLEGLYKAMHNGSLEGLDALIKSTAGEMK